MRTSLGLGRMEYPSVPGHTPFVPAARSAASRTVEAHSEPDASYPRQVIQITTRGRGRSAVREPVPEVATSRITVVSPP